MVPETLLDGRHPEARTALKAFSGPGLGVFDCAGCGLFVGRVARDG